MTAVRQRLIAQLLRALEDQDARLDARVNAFMALDATADERSYVAGLLAQAAVGELATVGVLRDANSSTLLDQSYRQLQEIVRRGTAIAYLLDRLEPLWSAWPDKPLVDVIKVVRPAELAPLIDALHRCGVYDLDELAP